MQQVIIKFLSFLFILTTLLSVFIYLSVSMPGRGNIDSLKPLTDEQKKTAERLKEHVYFLADDIGERHQQLPDSYNAAANYIEQMFVEKGFTPYLEEFGNKLQFRNIIAEHYGTRFPEQIFVVGAHYDTVWMSQGADDNASGVAVLLEMAAQISKMELDYTIRFIAFANEEYPHYMTDNMGSLFHARRSSERGENIKAMISLDMLGYYSSAPKSQYYPRPFRFFYPDKANFVAFVSNFYSRDLLVQSLGLFRETGEFPSQGLAAPVVLIRDVRRSDHAAFWNYGVKAFMVTDTAAYRNYAYHNVGDVPNTLDYESMARVTTGLIKMLAGLAGQN